MFKFISNWIKRRQKRPPLVGEYVTIRSSDSAYDGMKGTIVEILSDSSIIVRGKTSIVICSSRTFMYAGEMYRVSNYVNGLNELVDL